MPAVSLVGGVPEIAGGELEVPALANTFMANAGRVAFLQPSLTAITIFPYVPAVPAGGVPESCPVVALKVAHDGRLLIAKVKARPAVSDAEGVNA